MVIEFLSFVKVMIKQVNALIIYQKLYNMILDLWLKFKLSWSHTKKYKYSNYGQTENNKNDPTQIRV